MILNRQRRVRVPLVSLKKFLGRVRSLVDLPAGSLTVCFVTEVEITRLNQTYRGKSDPTDVLSFPAGRSADRNFSRSAAAYLGDIAISPVVARRNAQRFGRSLEGELRVLILHGVLHLMGFDHETDSGEMDRREARLRRRLRLD